MNFVTLSDGDALTATANEQSVTLAESNVINAIAYLGVLDANTKGDEVTISLTRIDKDPAPASTVVLPASVAITAPAASAAFSRANDDIVIDLTNEESTDALRLSWAGPCVNEDGLDLAADQASVTINAGTIVKREQVDANDPDSQPVEDTCTITLRVERRVTGTLDAAFKEGQITAVASSSVDVTSNL